jgi:hypothetical protein
MNGVKMIYPPDRLQKLFDLDPPPRIRHWLAGHRRQVQELRLDLTERPIGARMAIDIVLTPTIAGEPYQKSDGRGGYYVETQDVSFIVGEDEPSPPAK